MDNAILKGLIVFCLLMENGDGILGKSPKYIKDKYTAATWEPGAEDLLDYENLAKYHRYLKIWEM